MEKNPSFGGCFLISDICLLFSHKRLYDFSPTFFTYKLNGEWEHPSVIIIFTSYENDPHFLHLNSPLYLLSLALHINHTTRHQVRFSKPTEIESFTRRSNALHRKNKDPLFSALANSITFETNCFYLRRIVVPLYYFLLQATIKVYFLIGDRFIFIKAKPSYRRPLFIKRSNLYCPL